MGHMNVRVYLEKAYEGLGTLAAEIGLPNAFRPDTFATLIPLDQHIRFINEVMPGRPLTMYGCILEWDEDSLTLFQALRHSDGRPAAAVRTRLQHVALATGHPFPWNQNTRARLDQLIASPSDDCAPIGIDPSAPTLPDSETLMATVNACGAPEIGRSFVLPSQCDVHGNMLAAWFVGRISDSVPNLLYEWRQSLADEKGDVQIGAAVLEYRLRYRKWPKVGDRITVHTSLVRTQGKTHSLSHWAMDPDTGRAWMTSEAVAITFDLQARRAIPAPEDRIEELSRLAPKGLTI